MEEKARTPDKTPALPMKARTVYRKIPVIVEGVDCSGKTTFCKWLIGELIDRKVNVEFVHHGPLRSTVRQEYREALIGFSYYPTVIVGDRWHLGEAIYGPLYRGVSQMSDEDLEDIESCLTSLGAKRILMDPPADEVLRRMENRGEDFLKKDDLRRAMQAYRVLAVEYGYEDIRHASYDDAVRIAKEAADECGRHTLRIR